MTNEFELFLHSSQANGEFSGLNNATPIIESFTWASDSYATNTTDMPQLPSWLELALSDFADPMSETVVLIEPGIYVVTACLHTDLHMLPFTTNGRMLKANHRLQATILSGFLT
jgi:hypothetical protein